MTNLVSVVLVVVLAFALVACGREKPEAVLEKAIKALIAFDEEKIVEYFGGELSGVVDSTDPTSNAIIGEMYKNLTCTVKNVAEDGDTAVITAEITNTDFTTVMGLYMGKVIQYAFTYAFLPADQQPTEEEQNQKMAELFSESVKDESVGKVTKTVDINMVYADEKWTINADSALQEALTGGLSTVSF